MPNDEATQSEEILKEEEETQPNSDPLDALKDDPDALLAEAKKLRSIAQRKHKAETTKVETPKKEEAKVEYVTKADWERKATIEAKDLVSDDVKENWDELIKVPLGGYDPLDAKSIAKNMEARLLIYRSEKPKVEKDDSAKALTETKATGTGQAKVTSEKKSTLNIVLPTPPSEWYKPKA